MEAIVLTNLVDPTENGVRSLIRTHVSKVLADIANISIEGRNATVTFSKPGQAKVALVLNGKMQPGKKKIGATLVPSVIPAAEPKSAPETPVTPTKTEPIVYRPAQVEPKKPRPVTIGTSRLRPAPYHFVPVETGVAIEDTPVFHDMLDLEQSWSGELDCTLTALTPLLVANEQYPAEMAKDDVKDRLIQLLKGRTKGSGHDVDLRERKILEPLTSPVAKGVGRVLLPGSGLKGMLRGAVQSLLSAPMERVAERTASFRPHFPIPGSEPIRECVPALVIQAKGFDSATVFVLPDLLSLFYVRSEAVKWLPKQVQDLIDLTPQQRARYYPTADARKPITLKRDDCTYLAGGVHVSAGKIIRDAQGRPPKGRIKPREGVLPVVNLNGIDLFARLNRLFHEQHPELTAELETKSRDGYPFLLLELSNATEAKLGPDVLRAFEASLRHLGSDTQGHLRDHPQLHGEENRATREAIQRDLLAFADRGLLPGDILFVERDTKTKKRFDGVGHHAYARRRYRDSVHQSAIPDHRAKHAPADAPGLRDVLCPRPVEFDGEEQPAKLTGARLMFGYVGTTDGKYHDNQPTTFGIGKGDFAQLAGRIAINHAVEHQLHDNWHPVGRFLNPKEECLVPLRPVGSPKVSAVEHYLTQDRLDRRDDGGILCTYGDTPDDDSAGDLRGRKAYLHQPKAANDSRCFELMDKGQDDWKLGTGLAILSQHSAIARFVSRAGSKFRFRIRFVNLRPWELGALVFALSPTLPRLERLAAKFPAESRKRLDDWLKHIRAKGWADKPELFAQKLGHGRPLGMGSVQVECDRLKRLGDSGLSDAVVEDAIDAFSSYLADSGIDLERWVRRVLVPWLQVRRFVGRGTFDYPREKKEKDPSRKSPPKRVQSTSNVGDEVTAFNYHSNLRGEHARLRKTAPKPAVDQHGLKELDELDQTDK